MNYTDKKYINKFKKIITIGFTITFVTIITYSIFYKFIIKPKHEEEAYNELTYHQNLLIKNFLEKKLNKKNTNMFGFKYIIQNFPNTQASKLASYYLGIISFQNRQYNNAIKYFKNFSSNDDILNAINTGAIGDAYIELGNTKNAIIYFEKALKISNHHIIVFHFTHKLGILEIQNKNYKKALNYYLEAKKRFPEEFEDFPQLKSYITMLKYKNENQ